MNRKNKWALVLAALASAGPSFPADNPPAAQPTAQPAATPSGTKRCTSVVMDDQPTRVTLGKSTVIPLKVRVARILVSGQPPGAGRAPAPAPAAAVAPQPGASATPPAAAPQAAANDSVADLEVMLLSPTDLFFRGKTAGAMNVVLQNAEGTCFIKDVIVTVDSGALQATLGELMPEETGIKVRSAERSIVLTGEVSSALRLDQAMSLATSYGDGKKVVNMLRVASPQQVMLEVKVAEVSKTLLDNFGLDYARLSTSADGLRSSVVSGILGGGAGAFGRFRPNIGSPFNIIGDATGAVSGSTAAVAGSFDPERFRTRGATMFGVDAQKKDGLIRVLAEPNIMAISGQQASFLSGGKIFIPISQTNNGGIPVITLEEKEFGIGVKFTPTVLDGTRVHLKMVSEVSDLSQTGSPFTAINGVTAVLPSLTVRRADTTVQLHDGQSLVVAGLIKNNLTETIKRFPGLGEVPVVGALARSNEFQTDQTELLFVITPRLVKPLSAPPRLPTDNHVVPTRAEVLLNGALESSTPPADAPPPQPK